MKASVLAGLLESKHAGGLDAVTVGIVFSNGMHDQPKVEMSLREWITMLKSDPDVEMTFNESGLRAVFGPPGDTA